MTSVSIVSGLAVRIKYLITNEPTTPSRCSFFPTELESISRSLQAADQETRRSEQFVKLEKQIVQLCYEIDDVTGTAAIQPGIPSTWIRKLSRIVFSSPSKRSRDQEHLQNLESKLVGLRNDLQNITTRGSPGSEDLQVPEHELVRLTNYLQNITMETPTGSEMPMGNNTFRAQTRHDQGTPGSPKASTREETEKQVKKALLSRHDLSLVSIWGKAGIGKTTLAKKLFYHTDVRRSFQRFAWVPVSQECKPIKVFEEILLQLSPDKKGTISGMKHGELIQQVLKIQKQRRCLIVLDDVCSVQDWESIRVASFPTGSSSKILITTRSREVVKVASSKDGINYSMPPLTQEECFMILKETASFNRQELETVGKIIFGLCEGLPLMAIILGKSLRTRDVAARNQLLSDVTYYKNQNSEGEMQVLGLCYHRLPDELKPCLLYSGQFPEGHNIEVDKLHLLLESEDLISRDNTFMQPLRKILEDLARRKLIEVQEDKVSMKRMYKSCQLQDQVRSFCIFKGINEELFEIVDFKSEKRLGLSTRRLAVYLSKYEDGDSIPFSSQDMLKNIRSLLIFDTYVSQQRSTWPSEINDLKEFSRLRVLGFDGVDFRVRKFPTGIDRIIFLRYLSFRGCWLEALPSYVSKLPCLETLDLRVHDGCKMTIPNIISNTMKRLRHLYFPIKYESDSKSKLQLSGLERLEILVNFDTAVCNVNDLSKLKNLQVLTTVSEGNDEDLEAIVKYLDEQAPVHLQQSSLNIKNFDCNTRKRDSILEKLLQCKTLQSLHIEGQIDQLPKDHVSLSPNFTELIFDGSRINHEDDPINVLGNLPNLRNLVLTNDAFVGNEMFISVESKFPNLRSLKLLNLQYLEKLTFERGAMPMLSTLVIDKCDNLKSVLVPKALDKRLQHAQRRKRDDVYSIEPLPTIIYDN